MISNFYTVPFSLQWNNVLVAAKSRIAVSYVSMRRLLSRFRSLPTFLVIGAQKSGTTSLSSYLAQHPDLRTSFYKEVHFFDSGTGMYGDNYAKGENWYRAHFPLRSRRRESQQIFEATPMYLFHGKAAARIRETIPTAKLIVVLRNPVARAVSHYRHTRARRHEPLPMLEAMHAESDRIGTALHAMDFENQDVRRFSYKSRGLYAEQLRRYLHHFPANQLLVISSDELFADTPDTLRRIFEFIGVQPDVAINDLRPLNTAKDQSPVPDGVHQYLEEYFRGPNDELGTLLGRDFGW